MKGYLKPHIGERVFTFVAIPYTYNTRYNVFDEHGNKLGWCFVGDIAFIKG